MSSRCWCFTLNNYTDSDEKLLKDMTKNYLVYGKETGKEGTPHLQGYIIFKRTYRLPALKKLHTKIHWEVAKTPDAENYCMKDKDYYLEDNRHQRTASKDLPVCKTPNIKLFRWQQYLLDTINLEPDNRTIMWCWESTGNIGKTQFSKWLYLTQKNVLVLNGKKHDLFHMIAKYIDETKQFPRTVIVDIPRAESQYVSWGALEAIKSGFFASPKYEGAMVAMDPPHLIIFANYKLSSGIYSEDKIIELDLNKFKLPDAVQQQEQKARIPPPPPDICSEGQGDLPLPDGDQT